MIVGCLSMVVRFMADLAAEHPIGVPGVGEHEGDENHGAGQQKQLARRR